MFVARLQARLIRVLQCVHYRLRKSACAERMRFFVVKLLTFTSPPLVYTRGDYRLNRAQKRSFPRYWKRTRSARCEERLRAQRSSIMTRNLQASLKRIRIFANAASEKITCGSVSRLSLQAGTNRQNLLLAMRSCFMTVGNQVAAPPLLSYHAFH